jgi:hypothetical protein
MELDIAHLEEVWTADGRKLGLAEQLYHRLGPADLGLQLYASYLQVDNFDFGSAYFVPTEFIAGRDPESGRIELTATAREVEARTWTRMPDFVAHGSAQVESLPARS